MTDLSKRKKIGTVPIRVIMIVCVTAVACGLLIATILNHINREPSLEDRIQASLENEFHLWIPTEDGDGINYRHHSMVVDYRPNGAAIYLCDEKINDSCWLVPITPDDSNRIKYQIDTSRKKAAITRMLDE